MGRRSAVASRGARWPGTPTTAAIDPAIYPDIEEFWHDLSAAYAEQVRRIGELGCTYLQFDDTSLAYLNDPAQRAELSGRGEDAERAMRDLLTSIDPRKRNNA
ncbi:hypothetical protein ABGB18_19400 [Nonomuraea sp. B12E4]|uniref:hypothetical protein n=1 Tax=Nonomuraea sp. B12E4 TaxID=3153564 RepID=UPI00325EAB19